MSTDNKPCAACPWTSTAERDRAALTEDVRQAAIDGQWFCCHVHAGTCHGATRYGEAKRKALADQVGRGVPTTCVEHAYGSATRLSFQIKVF